MDTHKYYLTYSIDQYPDGIAKEEIPEGHGACDAIVVLSILHLADGSYSLKPAGIDGRTGKELSADEYWNAWAVFAAGLAESEELNPGKLVLAKAVHETVKAAMIGGRASGGGNVTPPSGA